MPEKTHPCPGRCGRQVPNRRFACGPCWTALPRDLQGPIVATAGLSLIAPSRMAALVDARQWYEQGRADA